MNETVYQHMSLGTGKATVAIRVDEDTPSHRVARVGLATCSPKDQFSRKRGRAIAEGRLQARKFFMQLTVADGTNVKQEVAKAIKAQARGKSLRLPSWAWKETE